MPENHYLKIVCGVVMALCVGLMGAAPATEPEVRAEDMPRVKPTEPGDVGKTFKVKGGFRLELVAAEPLVVDPIAMCFDENGRLFVVEMRDYSERREEKLGQIRMLEDTDGDGKFDKSTVFLENLPWPTALFYYGGGVVVGACPDIIYAKDTDGDGKADQKQKLFTGFGTEEKLNVQGLFNNFIWGLDNRIHGCSGTVGGSVRRVLADESPAAEGSREAGGVREAIDVRGKGLVIDPRTWTLKTENGGGQYGLSFDAAGRLFTCTNSSHIETFLYDARYARNPFYVMPPARVCIAADGPAAEVFRISPEEPWRVIRTRWRVGGLVKGPIEGGGRSSGYFTSASGVTIYKGNAFGADYAGDAFICDVGSNLIHHKRIRRKGLELIAERPEDEKKSEFIACSDNWFRPVDFANAPDGTLYVADMYRETIEHPWSLPPGIKKFLDLNSGNDRGRIYRIVPEGFKQPPAPARVRLGAMSTEQLVGVLEHPNGWHRETASRLLFERQDQSAVEPLRKLMSESKVAVGRLHAMRALDGLGALKAEDVTAAMGDSDAAVREHEVRMVENFIRDGSVPESLGEKFAALGDDPEITVRQQVAFTAGALRQPQRIDVLEKIIKRDVGDPQMRMAVLSSLASGAADMFHAVGADPQLANAAGRSFLVELARIVGASGEGIGVVVAMMPPADEPWVFAVCAALAEGVERSGKPLENVRLHLADMLARASRAASDKNATADLRAQAIALLSYGEQKDVTPVLVAGLSDKSPRVVQAALVALDRFESKEVWEQVIARVGKLSPRLRVHAVDLLIKRPASAKQLLDAIRGKIIAVSDVDAAQAEQLRHSSDTQVARLARELLPPPAPRSTVVESFKPAISMSGDVAHGKKIYQERCVSCHRAEEEGFVVGPDLVTVKNAGKEKLLANILDPSAEVAGSYVAYLLETKDGQALLGLISSDSTSTVTIRQAYGRDTVVERSKIKRMTSPGTSLMPDGLEIGLSQQDMADLLEFIVRVEAKAK